MTTALLSQDALICPCVPRVEMGGNVFERVPTVLQYEFKPLIEVIRATVGGFTTRFQVYSPEGVYLGVVKGSHLHPTEEGRHAGLKLEHPDKMTVCTLGGQTLFEVRRSDMDALQIEAEMYTPDGSYIRCRDGVHGFVAGSGKVAIQGMTMTGYGVMDSPIGVLVRSDGGVALGVSEYC